MSTTTTTTDFAPATSQILAIYTIIRDTLDKLDIISNLVPSNDNSIKSDLITTTLNERLNIENEFNNMIIKRDNAPNNIKNKLENNSAMKEILNSFHNLSKRLNMKLSSDTSNINSSHTIKLKKEKTRLINILVKTTEELKSTFTSPTLFKMVEEEKSRESRYENTLKYVHTLTESVLKLENAIDTERELRASEESSSLEKLRILKEEYQTLKSQVTVNQKFEEFESNAQLHTRIRVNASEESKVTKQLNEVREAAERERKAFSLSESYLRRKQEIAEKELLGWQTRYNTDVKSIMDKVEKLQTSRERLVTELRVTEELLQREIAEKDAHDAEEQKRIKTHDNFLRNVVIAQSCIRRFLARKRYLATIKVTDKKKSKGEKKSKKK